MVLAYIPMYGQISDSILLEAVEVKRYRLRDSAAVELLPATWTTLEGAGGLLMSLQQYSSAFVKSFGPGGIATISLDGLNPQHTTIFWNGVPVNNSITGIADLSIYPLTSGMNIRIPEANGMMEYTSGQLGGLLWMESTYDGTTGIHLEMTSGSFGRWEMLGSGRWSPDSAIFEMRLNAGFRTTRNDYTYKDYNTDPVGTAVLKNAGSTNFFVEPGIRLKTGAYGRLRIDALYTHTNRAIPPSVITPNNRADNYEQAVRTCLNWQYERSTWSNELTLGHTFDMLQYEEKNGEDIVLASEYDIHQVRLGERLTRTFDRHSLSAGGQFSYFIANGTQLSSTGQAAGGLFASWQSQWWKHRFTTNLVLRPEFQTGSDPSFSGELDLMLQPTAKRPFTLYLTGARNTRYPSLADLYFLPSGNPELDPEHSWKIKSGYKINWKHKDISAEQDLSGYNTWLDDMILWVPTSKQYWRPVNLSTVRARGIFLKNSLSWSKEDDKWSVALLQAYRLAISTNESNLEDGNPLFPNDLTIGKQLPYLPRHQLKLNARAGYAGFYLLMNTLYTSERFITGSNSYFLDKYWLLHLGGGYERDAEHFRLNIQFRVRNLLDNDYYQEVANIPMPPRNYEITIHFGYNK